MTSEPTARDRAWLDIIRNSLTNGAAIKSSQIEERADVSRNTARGVLSAAVGAGLLEHEEGEHWFYPTLGIVLRLDDGDDQLRRLFRDVMRDERAD